VEHERGPAGLLHQRSAERTGPSTVDQGRAAEPGPSRLIRVLEAEGPAVVLGSGQPESDIDRDRAAALGIAVVRRRSGGGAVLVGPGQVIWVDLLIPSSDPLWDDDVGRAAWWVGETWAGALDTAGAGALDTAGAGALDTVGRGPAQVWTGPMKKTTWSRQVCFAGVGSGEVLIGDRKVVGVSQRRTRMAALFQTAVLIEWDPSSIVRLLRIDESAAAVAVAELSEVAAGIGEPGAAALLHAFIESLMP
jgi:lipoate---protein ligase